MGVAGCSGWLSSSLFHLLVNNNQHHQQSLNFRAAGNQDDQHFIITGYGFNKFTQPRRCILGVNLVYDLSATVR